METIQWKVDGMSCANCALTIRKYLESEGQQNVKVNPIDGDVSFERVENTAPEKLKKAFKAWVIQCRLKLVLLR
jgi:Cu+-exporting ATPase